MESGGKIPIIVCDDADLDLAMQMCIFAALHHRGQICMSSEKIPVFESVMEPFKDKSRQSMNECKSCTDPWKPQLISITSDKWNRSLVEEQ